MQRAATRSLAPPSSNLSRTGEVGWLTGILARALFRPVKVDPEAARHVSERARDQAVVYVVRYRSWFDYLLVRTTLARAGMPRPVFAPDLPGAWLTSWRDSLRHVRSWLRSSRVFARARDRGAQRQESRRLVEARKPILIFMRLRAPGVGGVARAPEALARARTGADYLREIVIGQWNVAADVCFVPLAIVRGRGYRRKESKLESVVYTVRQAPGELRRIVSFLWNRRDTTLVVGRDVSLRELIDKHGAEGADRVARRLSRALQIFLYREERMVQGPTLQARAQVRETVLADPSVQRFVERYAWAKGKPAATVWRQARRIVDGMVANYQGFYVTVLGAILDRLWQRMFGRLDCDGLDRVATILRQHPIVLLPCHRSHFDYLILSYLFHRNHLSPPHIAAGDNLAFWPLGAIFRGAGAYFIRRSFGDDELYKLIFRSYLTFLIREGYTQEFFIEGGRSRTGKLLPPKLGMLSATVGAFLRGVRRDLYLVPVSIQYSRVVEGQAYEHELEGGAKEKESVGAMLRARRLLQQRYGDVQVTFAEPISLADALGDLREELRDGGPQSSAPEVSRAVEERRREFVESLAYRIQREINDASTVTATAVAATALLGARTPAMRFQTFLERSRALAGLLRACGAPGELPGDFGATRSFLEDAGLVRRLPESPDVIVVPPDRRVGLDFYKNNCIHWFLVPAIVTSELVRGTPVAELGAAFDAWLDLYRLEFPRPRREQRAERIAAALQALRGAGALRRCNDREQLDPAHTLVVATSQLLDCFHEPYWIVAQVLCRLERQGAGEKTVLERVDKLYKASFLLGEVHRPEGQSVIHVRNALDRYLELGCAQAERRPGRLRSRRRERWLVPGPAAGRLADHEVRLRRILGLPE